MVFGAKPRFVRVTTPKIAAEVQRMMEAVVSYGTGTSAQIPGVTVAGKTGTAELRDTAGKKNEAKDTDAWFVGYAPVGDPKVVVCALFPEPGVRRRHRRAGGQGRAGGGAGARVVVCRIGPARGAARDACRRYSMSTFARRMTEQRRQHGPAGPRYRSRETSDGFEWPGANTSSVSGRFE